METHMTCYFLHYRFKKMVLSQTPAGGPADMMLGPKDPMEVSLRPQTQAANQMLFKPKTPSMLPKSAISKTTDGSSPLGENSLLGTYSSLILNIPLDEMNGFRSDGTYLIF